MVTFDHLGVKKLYYDIFQSCFRTLRMCLNCVFLSEKFYFLVYFQPYFSLLPISYFFGREKKSGRVSFFLALFHFFLWQIVFFTRVFFVFFNFFHAHIFFSRANVWLFTWAHNIFHGQKAENFHG